MNWLEGKKTYFVGAAMFIIAGCHAVRTMVPGLSGIPDEYWKTAMDFVQNGGLTALGLMALRMALPKKE